MYQPLIPCVGCARHVRAGEATCPFCDAALPEGAAVRPPAVTPARGAARAARIFLGATLVVSGCGNSVTGADTSPQPDVASVDTVLAMDAVAQPDVPQDDTAPFPLYGGPFPRGDVVPLDAQDVMEEDAGWVALYGGPSPPFDVNTGG